MTAGHRQVEVTILGQGYVLACPEGGEALLRAAVAAVDAEMSAIRNAGRVKARERIAVLAALNLAYRLAERPEAGAGTAPAATAAVGAASAGPSQVELEALMTRIDAVLGDDDRLL
jgi:cell division protein ZapA